jgi:hypothetical protein
MKSPRLSSLRLVCLCLIAASVQPCVSQSAQPEPDTPTIDETIKYIQDHTDSPIFLRGSMLTVNEQNWTRKVNLLNVEPSAWVAKGDPRSVMFNCAGSIACVAVESTVPGGLKENWPYAELQASDSEIAPRVSNALRHLIRLLQQRAYPKDHDPFAR